MNAPYLIDTHAHLDADIYAGELDVIMKHARQENVWVLTVGSDYESSVRAVELANLYREGVYAAIGLHPERVRTDALAEDKFVDMERFRQLARHPKVVALGETGLDYHALPAVRPGGPDSQAIERVKSAQKKALSAFLQLSKELRLPLVLHCREAHEDMLEMLETWDKTSIGFDARGVIHCFTGDWKEARRYFNLDFMISLTGVLTHAHYQAEVIKKAPLSRILLESDCPYLTPAPWSIRRNEPSYLPSVAAAVAGIRGLKTAELAKETTANALKVFTKMLQ